MIGTTLLLLLAGAAEAAPQPTTDEMLAVYDGFEKCVIEQAFAAARTIPADREAARIGASRCGAEARAFAEVRIRQSFAKVPKKLRTHEEKIAWAIGRVQPSFEANAVRYLPEARRTGFKRVILSHPK